MFHAHTHIPIHVYFVHVVYEMRACLIVVPSSHKIYKIKLHVFLVQMILVVVVGDHLFGLISTRETRSKRLDIVEATYCQNLDSFREGPFQRPYGLQTSPRPKENL